MIYLSFVAFVAIGSFDDGTSANIELFCDIVNF